MKQVFKFCRPYLKRLRGLTVLLVVLYVVVGLSSMVTPYLTSEFIDGLINGGRSARISRYAVILAIIALLELILDFICERLYILVQTKGAYALNTDAIRHVQNVRYLYSESRNTAFLNQQINNDANLSIMFCITVLQNIISNVLTLVIPLVVIFILKPWLGAAMIGLNLLYFGLYSIFKKPVYKANYAFMEEQSAFFSKLDSQLCSVKFIQTQGIAKGFIKRLDKSFNILLGRAGRSQLAGYGFTGSDVIIKAGANILVFLFGGAAVLAGKLTVGKLTLIMSFFALSLSATQYFFGLGRQIQNAKVACDRLEKIFEVKEQTNGTLVPEDIRRIECRGLGFGYDDGRVFEGVNLTLQKGGVYAFAGENGSGKSTLINLILGLFIDEYEGSVAYDGQPIEQLDMREVRRRLVGVSEQEPMLLEDTLRFNLTLDENAELDGGLYNELCAVLHLEGFISALPNGLDTVINENSSNLSGGEKQKLSILRALLKRPKLLVLDEPTSALDKETRESLTAYLHENRADMITLISTHDKALMEACTQVVEM